MPSTDYDESGDKQLSAVLRTITVLEVLAQHRDSSLEELSRETSLPKATLLRFLTTLAASGYVYRNPSDRYSLTLKMFTVGSHSLEHIDLIALARPIAEELRNSLGETVHMGIRDDDEAVYILKVESKYSLRMHSRVGKSIPLYCTAIGKTLLAHADEVTREKLFDRIQLVPFTTQTNRQKDTLDKDLQTIRSEGYASDREEHEDGVCCLAAPISDYTGQVIAAISVSWPLFRYDNAREADYIYILTNAAHKITRILGGEASFQSDRNTQERQKEGRYATRRSE